MCEMNFYGWKLNFNIRLIIQLIDSLYINIYIYIYTEIDSEQIISQRTKIRVSTIEKILCDISNLPPNDSNKTKRHKKIF